MKFVLEALKVVGLALLALAISIGTTLLCTEFWWGTPTLIFVLLVITIALVRAN